MKPATVGAAPGAKGLATEARRNLGPAPTLRRWPRVSIVVLNRDAVEHLRRLLAGLAERTDYPDLEMILVDNASTDGSLDFMRRVEVPFPISVLANAHNESFSAGCNRGAGLASGELLLFLNNDAEPFEPGWLRELVACLRGRSAGAVVPTLLAPARGGAPGRYEVEQRGHRIGESPGGELVPVYRDRGDDPLGERLGEDVEVGSVAAACLLVERDAFDRVGGFAPGYWYGGEDSDLALSLRELGMSVLCSGRSLLIHPPGSTLKAIDPAQRGEWARGNRRRFMERWGPRVRREYELDRLRGGGLWSEPGSPGASAWGATEADVMALGFCLKSLGEGPEPPLDDLAACLRSQGRRAAVLRGDDLDSHAAFDYDVAVHFGGPWREPPCPSQLNLRWLPADAPPLSPSESRCYDLILNDEGESREPDAIEGLVDRLMACSDELADRSRYRRRVAPGRSG